MRTHALKGSNYAPDLAWQPLSKDQRVGLAMLARKAWLKWGRGESFDAWRHAQSIKAIGRRITEASQRDYLTLRATFLDLSGQPVAAMNTLLRADSEDHRRALFVLQRECNSRRLPLAYPEAICRKQYKCCLAEASSQQLYRLIFTIRNRRSKKPLHQ